MSQSIQIEISQKVFDRLQALAKPLVDTPDSVITRLLDFQDAQVGKATETATKNASNHGEQSDAPIRFFVMPRGSRIPLGKLRAIYGLRGQKKHELFAEVTLEGIKFQGELYDNLSSAGIAAKESVGAVGNAASTNGWDFWKYFDSAKGDWVSVDTFRAKPNADLTLKDLGLA